MSQNPVRTGVTLVELIVAIAIGVVLFLMIMDVHRKGMQALDSDQRKMGAWRNVHLASEQLRQRLFPAGWVWVVPLGQPANPGDPVAVGPPGSPLLYAAPSGTPEGRRALFEVAFDAAERRLDIGGKRVELPLTAVEFFPVAPGLVKYVIRADESGASTGLPPERERAALVSAILVPGQIEDRQASRFVLARPPLPPGVHTGFAP